MLVIKASAKPSLINGIGLFADEKIPKGTLIWKYDPRFDISFSKEEYEQMPLLQKELIKYYAYLSKKQNKYIYSIDDSRFTNHSSINPNEDCIFLPDDIESSGVANRDIEIGEEILVNYKLFDAEDETSAENYLNS
ncbi:MAG: SET domain-containing protein-lysine N-methyltransferase [Candidatus Vogelbacteria bacterium CG22_combo_CG10-13_8_21_14_all_37_9]|uniref:SET domain-containing protein-lysine N-methyltransferase n=1 Tax=Candidatus Vogelbacteria bacterium CG22_combo_CG10-13_8_21_14_all_37_9 TaxID=1975046 RepID=A0A2H0BL51_9BACT|nr:MAG: SET domain-containing protein-lysine N-methyltransferase [Candidatus Vogelbacteria bacterium CG22_combo_CG10-13_8_21_14_all_37_9]